VSDEASRLRAIFGKIARHRLTHFLVIGAALFALAPHEPNRRDVSFSSEQILAAYAAQSRRNSGRPVSSVEKQEAIDALIEEELLFREGSRLGLDRDDPALRARVIQRTLAMASDLAGGSAPVRDQDLIAHFETHRDRWRLAPRSRVSQVFIAASEAPDGARAALALRDRLRAGDLANVNVTQSALASEKEIGATLGRAIASAAFQQSIGVWGDPITSAYGWTLLRVDERSELSDPSFEQARHDVMIELVRERSIEARGALLTRLSREYRVRIDLPSGDTFAPTYRPTTHLDASSASSSRPRATP
jgi:hypothetical protein